MNTRLHSRTPLLNVHDSRGLPVRQVAYWRGDVSARQPEARVTTRRHDCAGHLVEQRDARLVSPTDRANLIRRCSLSGAELSTDSGDDGWQVGLQVAGIRRLETWDARGTHWQYVLDEQLRLVEVREPLASSGFKTHERLSYGDNTPLFAKHNQCGQLIRHDDPAGTVLFKNYALTGEVVEQTRVFVTDTAQPVKSFEPDAEATTRWFFNAAGDLCEQVDAKNNRQLLRQDVWGQPSEVRLQLNGDATSKTLVSAICYSAEGQVESQVAGNGVISRRSYRPADGRLAELRVCTDEGVALQALHYQYDPVGNVLSIEDKAQATRFYANVAIEPFSRFGYDSLYQLIEATGFEAGEASKGPAVAADPMARVPYRQTYRYDPGGNLLQLAHQGAQCHSHRLVAVHDSNRCLPVRGGREPSEDEFRNGFDQCGNITHLQPGRALRWDLRNQLREVLSVARDGAISDHEYYVYAADSQRVLKVRQARTSGGSVVAAVRYLPGLELRTHSGTNERLQVVEVQAGLSRIQVLRWESGPPKGLSNDSVRYTFTDHLGSCALELDSHGRLISRETYHPFGSTAICERGASAESSYRTFRYSGKEQDATGLYYYGRRYYVPWLQRWLNPDPGADIDGLNRYRMVRNNPVSLVDNDGLMSDVPGTGNPSALRPPPIPSRPALTLSARSALPPPLPQRPGAMSGARPRAVEPAPVPTRPAPRPVGKPLPALPSAIGQQDLPTLPDIPADGASIPRPYKSHNQIYQAPANQADMFVLERENSGSNRYLTRNKRSGSLRSAHGVYLFVNRVDEVDTVRVARLNSVAGHTSLTQDVEGRSAEIYDPVDVWYAGDLEMEDGELIKWSNASGHYKPEAHRAEDNLSVKVRNLLPKHKFTEKAARYLELLHSQS